MRIVESIAVRETAFGRDLLFDYLVALDIPYIFGNPGTTFSGFDEASFEPTASF